MDSLKQIQLKQNTKADLVYDVTLDEFPVNKDALIYA